MHLQRGGDELYVLLLSHRKEIWRRVTGNQKQNIPHLPNCKHWLLKSNNWNSVAVPVSLGQHFKRDRIFSVTRPAPFLKAASLRLQRSKTQSCPFECHVGVLGSTSVSTLTPNIDISKSWRVTFSPQTLCPPWEGNPAPIRKLAGWACGRSVRCEDQEKKKSLFLPAIQDGFIGSPARSSIVMIGRAVPLLSSLHHRFGRYYKLKPFSVSSIYSESEHSV